MKTHSLTPKYTYDTQYTPREQEILHLIVYEYSTREIADQLHISFETVKTHRKSLMTKLDARNVAGIVREAITRGLVDIKQNIIHMNHRAIQIA